MTKAFAVGGLKVAMATNSRQRRKETDEELCDDGCANWREFMMDIEGASLRRKRRGQCLDCET
jgi:hypothetical protein